MKRVLLAMGAVVLLTVGSTATAVADPPPQACAPGNGGYGIAHAVRQLDLKGQDLSDYIQKILSERGCAA